MPIIGLDHIAIIADDLDATTSDFQALLGRQPAWNGSRRAAHSAVFILPNVALVILPRAKSPALGPSTEVKKQGLAGVRFRVHDMKRLVRRFSRLRLQPQPVAEEASPTAEEQANEPLIVSIPRACARSIDVSFQQSGLSRCASEPLSAAPVAGLDHVVISTQHSEGAAAFYGARLGLELVADISRADWGVHLLFFRCGDLIVETAERLTEQRDGVDCDRLSGLSWRVDDAVAARERLAASGFDVSVVRPGRRQDTRVFSVRNRTADIPTVFIELPKVTPWSAA